MTANEDRRPSVQDFVRRLSEAELRTYAATACRLAVRLGLEATTADDVFQEALVRLLARNPVIESEAGFRAYLATVVRSIAFDALRRRRMEARQGRVDVPPEALEQIAAEDTRADHADVARLLAALRGREREVATLTLQRFDGVEIARALAIDSATVRSLLRRVRARFAVMTTQEG
jgi:RNA polymerase sigma factor (sigma-70 family)